MKRLSRSHQMMEEVKGRFQKKSKGSDKVPVALSEVNSKDVVVETSSSLFSFLSARERKQKKSQDKVPVTWSKDAGKVTKQSPCGSIVGVKVYQKKHQVVVKTRCDCDKYCKEQRLSQIFDEESEFFSSGDGKSEGPVAEKVTRQ